MKTGIVVGKVWATKRLKELPGGALLEIAGGGRDDTDERMIAFDPLGAGVGERVLVTQGSVAKAWFKDRQQCRRCAGHRHSRRAARTKTTKKS